MSIKSLTLFLLIILPLCYCQAQTDSVLQQLQKIPTKYLDQTEKKVNKYSSRLTSKTEKTLVKLSRWENKIHSLLQKANPEAANMLFAPNQMTFTSALQKYREGKTVTEGYKAKYDKYRDEMTTRIKYLESKKNLLDKNYLEPLAESKEKIAALENDVQNTEAMQQFIKERKKQLLQETMKYLGKNKYLAKINKESFYYTETLRNYKEIFSDSKKAEKVAMDLLKRIPAFQKFTKENSLLAGLFGSNASGQVANLAGMQTRASVNAVLQTRLASGGLAAREVFQQQMSLAKAEMNKIKEKILKLGAGNSDADIPDFKPNMQKTKTFKQRLEYGSNFQFVKASGYIPSSTDMALTVGYKVNDKSVIGIGASYKMGMGRIDKIRFTSEGIGMRSFMDWKIKKQFFISGGYEMNYNTNFKSLSQLVAIKDQWSQSGLLGISKKYKLNKKINGKIQLLWDFLSYQQNPRTQQIIFRIGYSLK